ncbi:MAG: nitronate monooxygenase [Thermodesulfobacteriota bacterium]|nr:nitronate monooxygenase [Thermodesulfobacteriota bacterium]
MIHTELCDLLGIKYPIILGGMGWVGTPELAAAVSNAGGFGILASGTIPLENLKDDIQRVRDLTDKPFGVNLIMWEFAMEGKLEIICDEQVKVITTGVSDPKKIFPLALEHGVKVLPVVPSVKHAVRLEKEGAAAIIASGCEGGGHVGKIATLPLVPQVRDAVSIPVIAAGGFGDSRGFVAALAMGACGIQMGTRFIVAEESPCHPDLKNLFIQASIEDTVVTGKVTGTPMRAMKNYFTDEWLTKEGSGISGDDLRRFGGGKIREGLIKGDIVNGSIPGGQIAGMIKKSQSVKEIMEEIVFGAEEVISRLEKFTT